MNRTRISDQGGGTPEGFEGVWPLVSAIDGWLSREQAEALHEAAGTVPAGRWIVEVGSHHGRSTVALAKGKPRSVPMLAVDPFPEPPLGGGEAACRAFRSNLQSAGVDGDVHLAWATSLEAAATFDTVTEVASAEAATDWSAPHPRIGLLFLDGLHDRDSVLADIEAWEPLVAEGGLVFFHDAFFRLGVTQALLERHLLTTSFRYIGSAGNLAMFRRERLGPTPALRSAARLLARLPYFARNVLVTIGVRRNWRWLLRLLPPEEDFEY